jgi:anaerobic ribonucleoside-triphosphate reductase activating protein
MRYHNITKDDMLNGDGLRVVLWVAGCTHQCPECHNPETWDINGGIMFDHAARVELFTALNQDYVSGITFSGGDPLHPEHQAEVEELARTVKRDYPDKTVWLYTGYEYEEVAGLSIMEVVDVLVDGRFIADQKDVHLHWRGSANQRVIDVPNTRAQNRIVLYCA